MALEEIGIVKRIIATPTKYSSFPLREALDILIERKEKQIKVLRQRANFFYQNYKLKKKNYDTRESLSQFVLIPKGKAFSNKILNLVENSRQSINIILPKKKLLPWLLNDKSIKTATERGIAVRIITEKFLGSKTSRIFSDLEKNNSFEIRYARTPLSVSLRIFDNKEALLTTLSTDDSLESSVVWSNNLNFVELALNYFESSWFSAQSSLNQELILDARQFEFLINNMPSGFFYGRIVFDLENKPVDFILLEANGVFFELSQLSKGMFGKKITEIYPQINSEPFNLIEALKMLSYVGQYVKIKFCSKTNQHIYQILAYSPIKGDFAAIVEDITEIEEAGQVLRESEGLYHTIFENSEDAFQLVELSYDENGLPIDEKIIEASEANKKQTGYTISDLIGKKIKNIPINNQSHYLETFDKVIKTKKSIHYESYDKKTRRFQDVFCFPYKTYIGLLIKDITKRKRSEEKIRKFCLIEKGIKKIFQETLSARNEEALCKICLSIVKQVIRSKCSFIKLVNEKRSKDISINEADCVKCKLITNQKHCKLSDFDIDRLYNRVLQEGKSICTNNPLNQPKNTGSQSVQASLSQFIVVPLFDKGKIVGIVGVTQEHGCSDDKIETLEALAPTIIEAILRKRTNDSLRESEAEFRAIVTSSNDVVYKMSADWNTMLSLVGKKFIADTFEKNSSWFQNYIPSEDQEYVKVAIQHCIESKSIFELEHRVIRVDGSVGWTFSRAVPILDRDEKIVEWVGVASDVTEHLHYQTLLDAFPSVAVLLRRSNREIVSSNRYAIEIGAVPGKTCYNSLRKREAPCSWCLLPKLKQTKKVQQLECEIDGVVWDLHWLPIGSDLYLHYGFKLNEQKIVS